VAISSRPSRTSVTLLLAFSLRALFPGLRCARGGIRTHKPRGAADFKSDVVRSRAYKLVQAHALSSAVFPGHGDCFVQAGTSTSETTPGALKAVEVYDEVYVRRVMSEEAADPLISPSRRSWRATPLLYRLHDIDSPRTPSRQRTPFALLPTVSLPSGSRSRGQGRLGGTPDTRKALAAS
jgi:hypothetical protein